MSAPPQSKRLRTTSVRTMQDLQSIKTQLAQQHALAQAQELAQRQAERKAQAVQELFKHAVGVVQPLRQSPRVQTRQAPPPVPVQQQRDEQDALRQSLSDAFDASTLLQTDDSLSYARPGVGADVLRKLRRGHWALQGEVDLHGLRSDAARLVLVQFLQHSMQRGWRCVRIIHGKGLGSPGKVPVLKGKVHSWLVQKSEVLAFVQARADEGGAGAVVVLLDAAAHSSMANVRGRTDA